MCCVRLLITNGPEVVTSPSYVPFIAYTESPAPIILMVVINLSVMTKVELLNEVDDPVAVNVEPMTMLL